VVAWLAQEKALEWSLAGLMSSFYNYHVPAAERTGGLAWVTAIAATTGRIRRPAIAGV
jgi:hypothetical protein